MKHRTHALLLFFGVLTAIALLLAGSHTARAEEAQTFRWYPVYYDDGVFYETEPTQTPPEEAEEKVPPACAKENGDGSFSLLQATGEWSIDPATGVCRPIYEETGTALYVVRKIQQKSDDTTTFIYIGGDSVPQLQEDLLFAEYGDRFLLLGDILLDRDGFSPTEKAKQRIDELRKVASLSLPQTHSLFPAGTRVEFDVNGHAIRQTCKHYIFILPEEHTEFYLFSSKPGALLSERDVLGNPSYPDPGEARHYHWSAGIILFARCHTTLVCGTFDGNDGKNLTMRGGVIINISPRNPIPDDTSSIRIDGANVHGEIGDSSALFVIRTYGGAFRLCNADVYISVRSGTEFQYARRCLLNMQVSSETSPIIPKTAYVENCRIYQGESAPIVNNLVADSTLVVSGTTGNYILDAQATFDGRLLVGEGNAAALIGPRVTLPEGYVIAKNRVAVRCSYTFPDPYCYDDTREDGRFFDYQDTMLELDELSEYGAAAEAVTVIWSDTDGSFTFSEVYVKGGTATYKGSRIHTKTVFTDVTRTEFDGWDGETENLQRDITFKPKIISHVADIRGLQYSVLFTDDFVLRLYLPQYDGIVSARLGDRTLPLRESVTIGDAPYFLLSCPVASNAVETVASFFVTVDDGVEFLTQEISFSLLQYAEQVLADERIAELEKALIAAAIAYAEKSAIYFNGRAPQALAALAEATAHLRPTSPADGQEPKRIGKNDVLLGAAFHLDANPDVIFYPDPSFIGSVRFSFSIGDRAEQVIRTANGTGDAIRIEDLGVFALSSDILCEAIVRGEDAYRAVGTYNLAAYAAYCRSGAVSEAMRDLADALLDYVLCAKAMATAE